MGVEGIFSIHCQSVGSEEIRVLAIGEILYGWKCERNEFSPYIVNQVLFKHVMVSAIGEILFGWIGVEWI